MTSPVRRSPEVVSVLNGEGEATLDELIWRDTVALPEGWRIKESCNSMKMPRVIRPSGSRAARACRPERRVEGSRRGHPRENRSERLVVPTGDEIP